MLSLRCFAECGWSELCIIACPYNAQLDQKSAPTCARESPVTVDENELLEVIDASEQVQPGRSDK
jgi:hypothetical protein